ncbi:hypothetical protein F5Y19DRAFT_438320 [Xylariaceae sp. FL1651]|nr:hypothetical protein F5Y19DRAFT_438320 [Xylariaceae sp. FL1651]
MLMPSALSSCDFSHAPVTRLQTSLFASPPASPPTNTHSTFGNIVSSCRALQSMLTAPPPMSSSESTVALLDPLPTPPMTYTPLPQIKMRLRPRKQDANGELIPRKKVVKRPAAPPRGANKRRRAIDDDMGPNDDIDSDLDISSPDAETQDDKEEDAFRPSTPKRARIAPESMPLGLERSDFHDLHMPTEEESNKEGTGVEIEADGEPWSIEDDRVLVELILEKLKLSKSDWQECARSLGKDRTSVGRRWKSLMVNGEVGLKSRTRRSKIHSTWR